ncbi:hypothetical protein TWF102_010158 [Orbilia oligospora]|uniref:Uncharacterized protein n=1 Tax=Orbilia oligospora TaxID=2813651 RepID=A0A7C8J1W7_ORBOL|nr:hypothetical protein TWF102_010158 [Orbilia oligospora]KAF3093285.1 hypothetical protein TWF103_011038 [Orbilia oligospora]
MGSTFTPGGFGALKARYNTNYAPGKVGIVMPAFAAEICWFSMDFPSIQAAIDLVLSQNWFIDPLRLSFRVNGTPATINTDVKPGDIIEIDGTTVHPYYRHKMDKIIEKRKRELEPPSSDDEEPMCEWDEDGLRGPTPPNSDGADGPWREPTYTFRQYRKMRRDEAKAKGRTSPHLVELYFKPMPSDLLQLRTHRPELPFADRVGPKVSEMTREEKKRLGMPPKFPRRKVKLRFHLVDFGERPIELIATNYEPLYIHFNILRRRLIRYKHIDAEDELDFIWPHLRWVPCGNTRVHSIRTNPTINTYACFVSKRRTEIGKPGKDDDDDGKGHDESDDTESEDSSPETGNPETKLPEAPPARLPEDWDPLNMNEKSEKEANKELSSLWDVGTSATHAELNDSNHDVQSQGNLIAFSNPGSPCPPTGTGSVSELSTIDHGSSMDIDIPPYITDDNEEGGKITIPEW